jgi:stage V sporulation protein AC
MRKFIPNTTLPEGLVMGTGAKLFTIAGPVLVYGISASVVYGLILQVVFGG